MNSLGNRILVIEDDSAVRSNVLDLLAAEGFEGLAADSGEAGLALALAERAPDLIICDVSMPGLDGYQVFERLSREAKTREIPFIFLTARAERADVRRGMALGADDYLTKPFTRRELLDSIHTRLRRRRSSAAPAQAGEAAGAPASESAMQAVSAQIERVARSSISVLILGETGVGKERVAERIHAASQRKGQFLAINCGALSETLLESELFGHEKGAFTGADRAKQGLFEAADGGTLFLDEVGELALATQVKLLRVLEARQVMRVGGRAPRDIDVRFVAATHRDVEGDVERGTFRSDLFYRLNGITLSIPPLRERKAEIEALAQQFIAESSRALGRSADIGISAAVRSALANYAWPGNIRELRNAIERAVLLCDGNELQLAHLPAKLTGSVSAAPASNDARQELQTRMDELERERIREALERCAGNQTQAAELLGISRRTLVTRLAQYGLPRPRGGSKKEE